MKGSIIGASLIISGTAIGGGMLAIPLVAGSLGFISVSFLLLLCWGTTQIAAFYLLHLNMAYPKKTNLGSMARRTLGIMGSAVTWGIYLLLLYSVLCAYMSGGASLLKQTLFHFFEIDIPTIVNAIVFTLVFGSVVFIGTRSVDYVNRVLLTCKIGAFFFMVALLLPHVRLDSLVPPPKSGIAFLSALPILITAFGYQMVIPSLRDYFHSDIPRIKKALWIGGTIPLVVYLLWTAVVFGLLPGLSPQDDLPKMVSMLQSKARLPFIGAIVNFFTDIAVTTSFLGVSMSLFHFIEDGFSLKHSRIRDKFLASAITFIPPLLFAWAYPKGFLLALSYAGIFIVLLFILIPLWMGRHVRQSQLKSLFPFQLHWTGLLLILAVSIIALVVQIHHFQ